MAVTAYCVRPADSTAGLSAELSTHWVADTLADLPATAQEGDTGYTKDTNIFYARSESTWAAVAGGSGEANTASNVGTSGVGTFQQKVGVDLQFKKLNPQSSSMVVVDDVTNSNIEFDITDATRSYGGRIKIAGDIGPGGALPLTGSWDNSSDANTPRVTRISGKSINFGAFQSGVNQLFGVSAIPSVFTFFNFGTASNQICVGNDSRLSDARTPTAHAPTHKQPGSDFIRLDEFAMPTDITYCNVNTLAHGLINKLPNANQQVFDGTGVWRRLAIDEWAMPTDITQANVAITQHGLVPKAPNDISKFLRGDGSWAAPTPIITTVKKTSDQTTSSSTPGDVTALVFAVTNGAYYHFKFILLYRSDTGTIGLKVALTTPTFTRFGATARISGFAGAGTDMSFDGIISASGGTVTATAVNATNTDTICEVEGVILPSADGNVQLQFALETGSAAVVTARQGSCGILTTL